jgi:hypothetical protein
MPKPTTTDIVTALRDMSLGEFRTTIARARPPEDYDSGARRAAAAEALQRHLHQRAGNAGRDGALADRDPAVRKAAARQLLHGDTEADAAQRKTAAVVALSDYQDRSLGRGSPGWSPQTGNPSDRGAALDAIADTGIRIDYSRDTAADSDHF